MNTFIGRNHELAALQEIYEAPDFQMAVIYGRRRIGKSTLIAEFIKDKKAIYYTATKVGVDRNVKLLGKAVTEVLAPTLQGISFDDIEALFSFLTENLPEEKLVFVIDELPYWADMEDGFLSVLQKYIDQYWKNRNFMMILCGSSLSFMENKVLSEKSPLFGRRTIQIELKPFDYLESAAFVPHYTYEEKAITYGVTGGIPYYLSLFQQDLSLDENMIRLFFNKTGYLYDEPRNLLTQEFQDVVMLNRIIEQIAAGENTLSLISDKVHEKSQTVLYSLEKLVRVGLVEKKSCITEENNRKKVQYVLKDQMFRFWYTFLPEAVSTIELGQGAVYFSRLVKPKIHQYMGKVFEEMCCHYVLMESLRGHLPCLVTKTGSWWGTEVLEKKDGGKLIQTADIDVVGLSPLEKSMVVGECKFKSEKLDRTVYETLVRRSKVIPTAFKIVQYLLFSLGGFTEGVEQMDKTMVRCVSLEEMYEKTDD